MRISFPRQILILSLCLLLSLLPVLALADGGTSGSWLYVQNPQAADRLNLRKTASKDADSLGRFYTGTAVQVLGQSGDFSQVKIGDLTGYMQTSYLVSSQPSWNVGKWGIVNIAQTDGQINLRSKASSSGTVLGTYPNGTCVQILGESGDFYQVRAADQDGYMQKNLLLIEGQGDLSHPYFTPEHSTVRNDKVNLRAFPSREGASILKLPKGATVSVVATMGPWYYVVYSLGSNGPLQTGFVLGNQLALRVWAQPGTSLAVVANPNESDRLILRDSASEKGGVLGRYYNGTDVVVLEKNGKWWKVQVAGIQGYMDSNFLQTVETYSSSAG